MAYELAKRTADAEQKLATRDGLPARDGALLSARLQRRYQDRITFADRPERLVPNVLLRPACQDFLFPTIATVCGPAEVAYLAQVGEIYARHGVPRPAVEIGRAHV